MCTSRVHEHIYTDKNLFNDFIRLQNKSIHEHYVFTGFFQVEFGIIYKLQQST